MTEPTHTTSSRRRIILAALAYVVLMGVSVMLLSTAAIADSWLRIPVAVMPMVGMVAIVWVLLERYGVMDEYWQTVYLEAFPFAFFMTMGLLLTWGLLEAVGAPRLSGVIWFFVAAIAYRIGLQIAYRRHA